MSYAFAFINARNRISLGDRFYWTNCIFAIELEKLLNARQKNIEECCYAVLKP